MENSNGSSHLRNLAHKGSQSLLPPKSTSRCTLPSNASSTVSEGLPEATGGQGRPQRTSSDSFLLDEQPSWLEELLDEPETPIRRRHRRSSSDSVAFLDGAAKAFGEDQYKSKNIPVGPSSGPFNSGHNRDWAHYSLYANPKSSNECQSRVWGSSFTSVPGSNALLSSSNGTSFKNTASSSCTPQERNGVQFQAITKKDGADLEGSSIKSGICHPNPSASRTDSKRTKQQFAEQTRIRKLQYIADLERNVEALQVEGYGVSAELEFLDQQNLILGMENMALKQRLESLSREQFLKYVEQDMLKREIVRLRCLYHQQQHQQQQQQQQKHFTRRRTKSRDPDSQSTDNAIKQKEPDF